MYSSINGKQKGDCPTVGFPIFFSQDYEVAAEVDTSAAPLIPSAAPLGVMSNFSLDNQSCNELTLTLEFWSSVADCDGCTTEIPLTETQTFTIPPNTSFNPPAGNWVDYSIDGGVFLQDVSKLPARQ